VLKQVQHGHSRTEIKKTNEVGGGSLWLLEVTFTQKKLSEGGFL
jgi:hypothetical protein